MHTYDRAAGRGGFCALGFVLACVTAPAPPAAEARSELRCEIRQFGIFELAGTRHYHAAAKGSRRFLRTRGETHIEQETAVVPMTVGTSFGVQTIVLGRHDSPEADFDTRWTIPPRIDPSNGEEIDEVVAPVRVRLGRRALHYFTFADPWELVAGTYRFEVYHEGVQLCAHDFEIVEPRLTAEN